MTVIPADKNIEGQAVLLPESDVSLDRRTFEGKTAVNYG
jgi:hypothetical protein